MRDPEFNWAGYDRWSDRLISEDTEEEALTKEDVAAIKADEDYACAKENRK